MSLPVHFVLFNHLPSCRARVDRNFPHFALNYGHAGKISWQMDGGHEIELSGPVAWWTWPGPRFTYGRATPDGWDHCYVAFRGRWARDLAGQSALFPRERPWQLVRDGVHFAGQMQAIVGALAEHDEAMAWSRLLEALLFLRDERGTQPSGNPREEILRRLIGEIRRAPARRWSATACARQLGFSPPHFRRLFRSIAGYPFHHFILRTRMLDAARRLRSGTEPVKAVAESCGAGDICQFSRQFRAVLGQPPATYRDQSRLAGN